MKVPTLDPLAEFRRLCALAVDADASWKARSDSALKALKLLAGEKSALVVVTGDEARRLGLDARRGRLLALVVKGVRRVVARARQSRRSHVRPVARRSGTDPPSGDPPAHSGGPS